MSIKIVSMAPLPAAVVQAMIGSQAAGVEIEVTGAEQNDEAYLAELCKDAELILGDYTFEREITAKVVEAAEKLRFIQQPSAGYQHIDADACAARGVPVANTAGANDIAVAEHTIMLALALIKRVMYSNKVTHEGRWEQSDIMWKMGLTELHGRPQHG